MRRKLQRKSKYKQYTEAEIKQLMIEQQEYLDYFISEGGGRNNIVDLVIIMKYLKNFKSKVPDRPGKQVMIMNGKVVIL